MSEDHLDKETSVSAELTETGVKAAAKSRAIAALDRLLGNVADLGNSWIEGMNIRRRAKNEGERQIIEAAAKYGLDLLEVDDAFAKRTFENHYKKIAQQQLNKDAVVAEALEDLRQNPPTEEQATAGPIALTDDFLSRFEEYAESATTEQLRERWGRILAGEIRRPGTFNRKVLRATDELEPETAVLFESLMRYRVSNALVQCLIPDMPFENLLRLVSADLIVEHGLGHHKRYVSGKEGDEPIWLTQFGNVMLSFPQETPPMQEGDVIGMNDGVPSYGVYILTDVGFALSSILPSYEAQVGIDYAVRLKSGAGKDANLSFWRAVKPGQFLKFPFPQATNS